MNINYTRKQLKQAMDLLEDLDLTDVFERLKSQKKLNEAYSILFDLDNLLKMEEEEDD